MDQDYYNLLVLPLPSRGPEVEAKLAALSRETNIDLYTLRDRLFGRGLSILKRTLDRVEIVQISERLKAAGFAHLLFSDSEFRALPPARRAVAIKPGPDRLDFLNVRGETVNYFSRGEECLLVPADLAPPGLSAREFQERAQAQPAELLERIAMGDAVLDICPRNRPPRVRIFGKHFNYTATGNPAGLSTTQNLLKIVETVQSFSSGSRLELSFGFSVAPPIGGIFLNPGECPALDQVLAEKLRQFENFSRSLSLFYEHVPIPAGPPVPTGPAAPARAPAPVIPRIEASPLSSFQAGLNQVSAWGPPALVLPLLAAGLLLGAGYFLTQDPRLLPAAGEMGGLLIFFHGFVCLKRARAIESIPTSRIRSLPMGQVEVSGEAQTTAALKTPFTLLDCVWYQFLVEEYRRTGRQAGYVTVSRGNSGDIPFYVEDETGKILVDPRGALVEVKCRQVTYQTPEALKMGFVMSGRGSLRITEIYIPWKYPVYVIGTAQHPKTDPESGSAEILIRLRELKKSPEKLAAFDLNQDGRIDSEEWEQARAAVEQEILAAKLKTPAAEEQVFIGRGGDENLFLISDRSERDLLLSLRVRTWLGILGGGGLILAMIYWGWKFFFPE